MALRPKIFPVFTWRLSVGRQCSFNVEIVVLIIVDDLHSCSRARPAFQCAIALWLVFGIGRTSTVKLFGSPHAVRIVLTTPGITAPLVSIVSTSVLHRSVTVFWNSGNK